MIHIEMNTGLKPWEMDTKIVRLLYHL